MANNTTNPNYWVLDTAAEIKAISVQTNVKKLVLIAAAANDAATIQEYSIAGSLIQAAYIKAGATDATPVVLDFGHEGRNFNGFKMSAITAGAALHVYL
jgi:hypothetical protein